MQCCLLSLRSFVVQFDCCLSCPCQMQMWGNIWQHVAWTSHHCCTLPCAIIGYELPTLHMLTESLVIPYASKGEQFSKRVTKSELPWLCSSAYALSHMTEQQSPLLYTCRVFVIATSMWLQIIWIINFFDQPT
jgi:hypothetical protein